LPNFFFQHFWAGLLLWVALYISDYTLTMFCARLYAMAVRDKIVIEGSYELTPFYQKDIDSLRLISPRFVAVLLIMSVFLYAFWNLTRAAVPEMYLFILGMLVGVQLAVHVRHLRNLFTFRAAQTDAIRGRIEYSRPMSLRVSAVEMLSFAGLYFVLFLLTGSWFILGGTLSCLTVAIKHRKLAVKHVAKKIYQSEEMATKAAAT